ncbi:proline rich transmembrane protein 1B-like [Xenopus laevis]|uniref:Proline rich transmembrane protein 1B-like n=1 Tax=Xenopus laevis TaxID=8355 RepID=A0A8J1LAJ5_XENLA|nr:proline rich transmembrane protein 1B-like [Xenopus laevis]
MQQSHTRDDNVKSLPPYSVLPETSLTVGDTTPPVENIKDYLVASIMNILCCCLPIGVAALVYSIQTREAVARRDTASAKRASQNALHMNVAAFAVGIFFVTLMIIYYVIRFNSMKTTEVSHEDSPYPRLRG